MKYIKTYETTKNTKKFLNAAEKGNYALMFSLLTFTQDIDINKKYDDGDTALHELVFKEATEHVKLIHVTL
jgi:hypothetical protein